MNLIKLQQSFWRLYSLTKLEAFSEAQGDQNKPDPAAKKQLQKLSIFSTRGRSQSSNENGGAFISSQFIYYVHTKNESRKDVIENVLLGGSMEYEVTLT